MSDRVATLAVWDVLGRRWIAALTSPHVERIEAVRDAVGVLVPTFFAVVDVVDDVDAIEAAVAALKPPAEAEVFEMYFQACQLMAGRMASEAGKPASEPLH